jgi:serine/threonine protein kinase
VGVKFIKYYLLTYYQISHIEYIHSRNFIHRIIKRDNLMGIGKRDNQVNVVDFDLAKKYGDPKTHLHITVPDGGTTRGRPAGAAIVICSVSLARRDDLDSLAMSSCTSFAVPFRIGLWGDAPTRQPTRIIRSPMGHHGESAKMLGGGGDGELYPCPAVR